MTVVSVATQKSFEMIPHAAIDLVPATVSFSSQAVKARVQSGWENSTDFFETAVEELPKDDPSHEFRSVTALREFVADKAPSTKPAPLQISPLLKELVSPACFAVSGAACLASAAAIATPAIAIGLGTLGVGIAFLTCFRMWQAETDSLSKSMEFSLAETPDERPSASQPKTSFWDFLTRRDDENVAPELVKILKGYPNSEMTLCALNAYLDTKPVLSDSSFVYLMKKLPDNCTVRIYGGLDNMYAEIKNSGGPELSTLYIESGEPMGFVVMYKALSCVGVVHDRENFLKTHEQISVLIEGLLNQKTAAKNYFISQFFSKKIISIADKAHREEQKSSDDNDYIAPVRRREDWGE